MSEERFNKIEAKIENLSKRLRHLEQVRSDVPVQADRTAEQRQQVEKHVAAPRPDVRPTPPKPQRPVRQRPETVPATPKRSPKVEMPSMKDTARKFEELLGGRLLAWAGGAAFIVGVGFFLALAISNGWIGETARTIMAFIASVALLGGGVLLHEKKGRTQASLAIASAGIAGLFLSLVAATQLYDLIPLSTSLGMALGIGAVGTAVAVRFSSETVGGLGLIGAILAPALVGADASGTTVAFILVALASTVGVLAWQKWWWLAYAAFIVSAPQIVSWVDVSESGVAVASVLSVFLVLNIGGDRVRATCPDREGTCVITDAAHGGNCSRDSRGLLQARSVEYRPRGRNLACGPGSFSCCAWSCSRLFRQLQPASGYLDRRQGGRTGGYCVRLDRQRASSFSGLVGLSRVLCLRRFP